MLILAPTISHILGIIKNFLRYPKPSLLPNFKYLSSGINSEKSYENIWRKVQKMFTLTHKCPIYA